MKRENTRAVQRGRVFRKVLFVMGLLWPLLSGELLLATPTFKANSLYRGEDGKSASLDQVVRGVSSGTVVILSELHDSAAHHAHQLDFLTALHKAQPELIISVAMEFFDYTTQLWVNQYLSGGLSERQFLEKIKWQNPIAENLSMLSMSLHLREFNSLDLKSDFFSDNRKNLLSSSANDLVSGFSYDFYRPLVKFSQTTGGWSYGINAPRSLTSRVGRVGLDQLTEDEKQLLPPGLALGRDIYKNRFRWAMGGGHGLPEEKFNNYFAAQSVWDDTMAWKVRELLRAHPDQVIVIIVGDFHNAYGGGLPDRLKARGVKNLLTISQVSQEGLSEIEKAEQLLPHKIWGVRAHYVWTDEFE